MDFSVIMNSIITYFQTNLYVTIALVIVLVFLLFRMPKLFFTLFFITLILVGLLYLISNISSTGVSFKKGLIHKQELP